ncbi:hypothetical protein, variant 1 [Aphanomyces astaci]|uniref:RCC1-like domain-containing protein n=1 Tax=Aphanomyces astaci TaxID=112090 RepID=W4G6K8_APHAT|nr:hypothetical protein, variant 1 [Aphanomyces astaci]ETV75315.1 hypothetical protein, variant 1 [Aphanomyces astaci]|eukprot:XP_009835362.1 hypothetical protein, variant 1 [Aphanomyces astaci]
MPDVYAWGSGSSGQLGTRDELDYAVPVKVDLEAELVTVTTGGGHSAGWTASGQLYTWGDDSHGQLGRVSSSLSSPLRVQHVEGLPPIQVASCGWWHTVAISQCADDSTSSTTSTQVFAWGHGHPCNHTTGIAFKPNKKVPLMAAFPSSVRITSVSCGWKHSLLATRDGRVFAWGKGRSGELAMGPHVTDVAVPTVVPSLTGQPIRRVCCGWQHSVFLTDLGHVWTSGSNKHGQLGVANSLRGFEPCRALIDDVIDDVAVGWHHVVCIGQSGVVYSWGKGDLGQLGSGVFESTSTPQPIPVGDRTSPIVQVASGSEHSLFVTAAGDVYSCGWGEHGNLGHDDTANVASPTKVEYFYARRVRIERCVAAGAVSIAITH